MSLYSVSLSFQGLDLAVESFREAGGYAVGKIAEELAEMANHGQGEFHKGFEFRLDGSFKPLGHEAECRARVAMIPQPAEILLEQVGGINSATLALTVHHTCYAPCLTNCSDEVPSGIKTEVFHSPCEPERVELFWSVTRYSALTRNPLSGKSDQLNGYNNKPGASGNITVTFSFEAPKDSASWMPVNAGEYYYCVVRHSMPDVGKLPPKACR